ncbi:hypothetical protein Goshw_004323 [Gossypium schwendimanii]|uniref:Uncharacterized protein n=1 Tax=Gossypium schwendimanii TaxID=34291 RepID=A0A7J9MMN7_GOSSC|nr:hypothetical protein [Gossypium schwendimanii]
MIKWRRCQFVTFPYKMFLQKAWRRQEMLI